MKGLPLQNHYRQPSSSQARNGTSAPSSPHPQSIYIKSEPDDYGSYNYGGSDVFGVDPANLSGGPAAPFMKSNQSSKRTSHRTDATAGSAGNAREMNLGSAAFSDADLIGSLGGEIENVDLFVSPSNPYHQGNGNGRHAPSNQYHTLPMSHPGSHHQPMSQMTFTPPIPEDSSPFDRYMMRRTYDNEASIYNDTPGEWGDEAIFSGSLPRRFNKSTQQALQPMSVPIGSASTTHWDALDMNSQPGSAVSSPRMRQFIEETASPATMPVGSSERPAVAIMERRRRRRESHNAVERRRRDNINEKIQELASLMPDLGGSPIPESPTTKDSKPNKGIVLRKSVDYIRHLQQLLTDHLRREAELEDMVRMLGGQPEGRDHRGMDMT